MPAHRASAPSRNLAQLTASPAGTPLGCFRDQPILRSLDGDRIVVARADGGTQRAACLHHCEAGGWLFGGLQRTSGSDVECWCGDASGGLEQISDRHCSGTRGGRWAITLLRTPVPRARAVNASHAVASLCSPNYDCYAFHVASLREHSARTDLHLHERTLEPSLPLAYSKLTVLHRLVQLPYRWVWWLDCDTYLLTPGVTIGVVLARHGLQASTAESRRVVMLAAYEPWGWTRDSTTAPGHPINTGSILLRGRGDGSADTPDDPAAATLLFLRQWVAACVGARQHRKALSNQLWEQQALLSLLQPEQVPGKTRRTLWLRNGTVALLANPSFNTYLCPTERTLEDGAPPEVVHLVRGAASLGRCSPQSSHVRTSAFKAVLMGRIAIEGLQAVRYACCANYTFRTLRRSHWGGGDIGTVNASEYAGNGPSGWPPRLGGRPTLAGHPTRAFVRTVQSCGVPADEVPLFGEELKQVCTTEDRGQRHAQRHGHGQGARW